MADHHSRTSTLFISDLHLCPQRPEITELFLAFLLQCASRTRQLYILGDLFEAWLGDDCDDDFSNTIISALYQLACHGTDIAIMHGNRDFLIGSVFAERSGCRLIDDPTVICLDSQTIVLSHGDALCTDDVDYQAFRHQVRNPAFQRAFLSLPLNERLKQAQSYREMSKTSTRMKAEGIMDVNQTAVSELMTAYNAQHLVHGHTHRPAIHQVDDNTRQRIVLGDWGTQGSVLIYNENGFQLRYFDTTTLADIVADLT